jgi:SP family general alpha glucoside:H+ symporter-like MFS transporter
MLNPAKANLKGKAAFVPAAFILIIGIWSYFRFPETKGRSFEDLDIMFARGVPARQFGSYVIQPEEKFGDAGSSDGVQAQ